MCCSDTVGSFGVLQGKPWWPHKMARYHLHPASGKPASVESVGMRFGPRITQFSAIHFLRGGETHD